MNSLDWYLFFFSLRSRYSSVLDKYFFVVLLFLILGNQTVVGQDKATVETKVKNIKTYPYSDPNPIPSLAINNNIARLYPYFMYDGYTTQSASKKWKVITLENPFIKVKVLPEVGGKVWGAVEKSTGKEFVYLNDVLKFRAISIRGPWTSGGIEHNFGVGLGHAAWTASPVDYIIQNNPDGSRSVIVGGLDLASRKQWRVNIRLPKDKAYFQTESFWYNPSPLHGGYLAWENAAFKATSDLQLFYPGNHSISHGGSASPWPVDNEGRDLSWYKENNFGGNKSYHVMGTHNNWYGGYWHDSNFGFGQWSLYSDAPGKKIWLWSLAREGGIWEGLLTDTDGQYMEAQTGVKFNQASLTSGSHSPFNQISMYPNQSDTKTNVWFPVKNTGGIKDAGPVGTLNIFPTDDSLQVNISPNVYLNDSLVISRDNTPIYFEDLSLKPMDSYNKTISLQGNKAKGVRVRIGKNKLSATVGIGISEKNRIDRPVKTTIRDDYDSASRLFRMAEDKNEMRLYNEALQDYRAILNKNSTNNRALNRIAKICYRKAQYEEGSEYALKALQTNTYNADANYIYGALQRKLGHLTKAEEAFSIAAQSMKHRSGAYSNIAGISIKRQNYEEAVTYAKMALDYNVYNLNAYEFLVTSYRKLNEINKAEEAIQKLLQVDPLNHYARFERYLLHPSSKNLTRFKSLIRNEFPQETYLELAVRYAAQEGLTMEAIQLLNQAPSYPTVYYWLAYLQRNSSVSESQKYLKKAVELSPDFVFPFRLETLPVLSWANNQQHSWKTTYYLGLIHWSKLQKNKAKELFNKLGNTPDYAPFYISRARLIGETDLNSKQVIRDYKKAKKLDSDEWRAWNYLTEYYLRTGSYKKQLNNAKDAFSRFSDNSTVGISYAKVLFLSNDYTKALEVLDSIQILPQEHGKEGQITYERSYLALALEKLKKKQYQEALDYLAKSKEWPENLGSGKPFTPDTRLQDYIAAYCESNLGNAEKSHERLTDIKKYTLQHWTHAHHGTPTNNAAGIYIGAKILKKFGKNEKADQLIKEWEAEQDSLKNWKISQGSNSPKVQWVIAKSKNQKKNYKKIERKLRADKKEDTFQIFLEALDLINSK